MGLFIQDIYAEDATSTTTAVPSTPEGKPESNFWVEGLNFMFMVFLVLVVMWFLLIRPQQREQKNRQAMWDSLRKLDKIVTVGGIHGVVTDIDRDKNTLTLRVDEDKNIKITIWISCVGQVLSDE